MKRIFPVITVLVLLSLLGLIFFQYLWIKSARETKVQQFEDNVRLSISDVGVMLTEDDVFSNQTIKRNDLFSSDPLKYQLRRPSVAKRYSKEEVSAMITKVFNSHGLSKVPFEFAIGTTSVNDNQINSDNFYKYYQEKDSIHNLVVVYPLTPSSGSDYEGLVNEEMLVILIPHQEDVIWKKIGWFIAEAIIFTLIITAAFFLSIRAMLRQKKLSEIKNDFINNMTHEFKTPLATISLAVDALKNEKVVSDPEKTNYFTSIIKQENKRMNKQVETILQAALLDKQEVQLNFKKLPAHLLIRAALSNIELQVEEKKGKLDIRLEATKDMILADEVHFTNLVNNLLDNAVKYSKENLEIKLSTSNQKNQLQIKIEDNGIGMNKETLNRIFEKFYRAHTGNIHNVKGFGLGLSYVKTMVEAHHGTIKAESVLGKGSTFIISIPLAP